MILKKYLCELNVTCLAAAGLSLALLLCSCESPKPPAKDEKKPAKDAKKIAFPEEPNKPGNVNQAEEVEVPPSDKSKHIAMLEKSKIAQSPDGKTRKKFYQSFLKKKEQKNAPEKVAMDFKNADLADLIPMFASVLKFNYTLDPEVRGVVTMSLNTTMTEEEVWNLFEQSLNLCGAYCSERDGIVNILPFAKMPQQQQLAMGFKPYGNAETLLYNLQTISPADAAKQIKPFMTTGATAIEMPTQNAILLVDVMGNIPKLYELLRVFDQKPSDRLYRIVLHCNNISASKIVNELTEILPILGFPVSSGQKAESGVICLSGIDRLQLIVATAANEEALEELKKWVETLDSSYGGEQEKVYIYKIVNSKATELVQALSAIFKVEGTTMAADSKTTTGGKGSTSEKSNTSTSPSTSSASSSSSKQKDQKSGPSSVFETPVSIFADAINNRLVIKTTPRTYAMLAALLRSLDTVPDQVLLQVLVAEVTLSDSTSFGVKYSLNENNGDTINWIQTNYKGTDPNAKDKAGLSYLLQSSNDSNKNVYLNALAGMTGVKVISSPQLLVTSHSAAKISVGDSVPIITAEITDTQSSADPNNTAVRRSV
ncbi:MAG: type II secretion system protein D, partial [Victivallaceae bacterium]